ncbi:4-hydroxythreonine-4-phosphate dehydrogenase PdxA [uncultured Rubinisphaera sp.]|uniref:4-hydroxythreonine-4-phosphate dehydrogenase PdxA n=1 Tax=uncultured Rubinisphaera sp. TaxID=1678686 RepID=UPI0030D9C279
MNTPLNHLPRLAVTMGDPAGVGPELCLQLLNLPQVTAICQPLIFGDASVLKRVSAQLSKTPGDAFPLISSVITWSQFQENPWECSSPAIIDMESENLHTLLPGQVSAAAGQAAFCYLDRAINACLDKWTDAVVTAPLHKEALHVAGYPYPGHTEILAEKTGADPIVMMLTSPEITCSLVTAHVGLHEVPALLSTERICETIQLTNAAMQQIRGRTPQLTICGLNPHAGEHGLFGQQEEERFIQPAIEWARNQGIQIEGPYPPDTAFMKRRREVTDAYICMYHDQGLIPLKALAFDDAVNVTLGLPIVRTSVDHGTAFDIAWQGKANVNSLIQAVELAIKLIGVRR